MTKNKLIPYNPKLKTLARSLRKNSTLSEILLWNEIKAKGLLGYEFHRQVPMDEYIVDFFCHELMLAIEIDGNSHAQRFEEDEVRQHRLKTLGVDMLRFDDREPKRDMNNVLRTIQYWIEEKLLAARTTSPLPPSKGES